MIVDSVQALGTKTLLLPTSTHHHHVIPTPLPSIIPSSPVYEKAGNAGERTLWVVFIIMLISSAVFAFKSWSVPASKNLFHVVTTLITIIATLSYFAMATGHGVSYHHVVERQSHPHVPDTTQDVYRQVYWARYVDWSLTTPLLILDLGLLAGLNGSTIFKAVVADVIMILTGLFAAFGNEGTPQKWGWYTIACIAYLVVIWQLAVHGRGTAEARGQKVGNFFTAIAGFTLVVWTAYPIVWGIADGSRRASVNTEIVLYAILDVLAKPVFGTWLLINRRSMPETEVDSSGFWANGVGREGLIRVGDDDDGA